MAEEAGEDSELEKKTGDGIPPEPSPVLSTLD